LYSIVTEGLGRRFGDRWAVQDLSLSVRHGEVFGLLGPNGAGKTTTMRMLACLIAPTEGSAVVCGHDVTRDARNIRRITGILSEPAGLYDSLSAQRNLDYYGKLYELDHVVSQKRIERYLRLFDLWDRRHEPAGSFSRGMKQKLSLARALLHEPSVVILDEPTSALDPEGAKLVRDAIRDLKGEGRTIILCTHNLNDAQALCDRVAIIKTELLRMGTPRELQASLYGLQVEIRISNALPEVGDGSGLDAALGYTMNDLALVVTPLAGVGDVAVSGNALLVSMLDPDETVPEVVRALVGRGADITRVAEVEHSLERAYLDLVARVEERNGTDPSKPKVTVA
jgi:ABC-2 type transport system ATP-binding protein